MQIRWAELEIEQVGHYTVLEPTAFKCAAELIRERQRIENKADPGWLAYLYCGLANLEDFDEGAINEVRCSTHHSSITHTERVGS